MEKLTEYKMVGLMSGTSGDGLDIAYCEFEKGESWRFQILNADTIPFPPSLEKSLGHSHQLAGEELTLLDLLFGQWMGQQVKFFCASHKLQPLAVASHGHTVFHQPQRAITKQIGNGWGLHQSSGLPVINDFRSLDVLLGGQGAPLVPIGDLLLFEEYDFCLNLGGIANISMKCGGEIKAFDVSPFNLLLNHFANKKGLAYDDQGRLAKSGTPLPDLLQDLENLDFYKKLDPKSLGRETIQQVYLPLLNKIQEKEENILATLVEHFSLQISKAVLHNLPKSGSVSLLVSGGGAHNQYFMDRLAFHCGNQVNTVIPEAKILQFKEAMIFAFLGVLRLRNEINCLCSVTGASRDSCGGTIYGWQGK
jgi:anhydro-N-acetylmuramic acid kinase